MQLKVVLSKVSNFSERLFNAASKQSFMDCIIVCDAYKKCYKILNRRFLDLNYVTHA
jgi:hypothetical protein